MQNQSLNTINHQTYKKSSIIMGIFFLLAFVAYGSGDALISSVTSSDNILANVQNQNFNIVLGAILIAILQCSAVGVAIIATPILKQFNQQLTYGYLAAVISSHIILTLVALFSLMLIPLAADFNQLAPPSALSYNAIANMLLKGSKYAYQIGMSFWSIGGLLFCVVLFQSKLTPKYLAVWGFVGYSCLLMGLVFQMFGANEFVEWASLIPGGLFEVYFALWLIFKGFKPNQQPAKT